jgi:glycosyltransferase involved in cell wall biosynthesis
VVERSHHIAIDARTITSSTGRVIERMLHHLQDIDHANRYTVYLRRVGDWTSRAANFHPVIADFADYSFAEQFGFKRQIERDKPDLVHFCMPQQPIFWRGRRVTTIFDLTLFRYAETGKSGLRTRVKQAIGWQVFKRAAQLSDRTFVSANYTRDDLKTAFDVDPVKIIVNPLAADVERHSEQVYAHPFSRYLLYVGHQSAYKNILALCEAHQRLVVDDPNLGLVLVGNLAGPAAGNARIVAERCWRNIVFTGFLPDGQRDWLFANAAAYVFPSLMEGFGLPGLEAMAHGTPVVSSNATCLPEVYGDAARYFDPRDTTAMAGTIRAVIDDNNLRQSLIEKGFVCHARYSWRRMAEVTLATYQEVLARRPA